MSTFPCPQYPQPPVTQEMYNELLAVYTSGAKVIKYADKEVTFNSLSDLWRVLQWMQGILYPCSNAGGIAKYTAEYSSGIYSDNHFPENSEHNWRYR